MTLETDELEIARAVLEALGAITVNDGVQFSSRDALECLTIIRWESDGDAAVKNLVDINAKEGHPSVGLMQLIPSTFAQFALPGHDQDITDPVSNIIAGVRYALKRYGGLRHVPGIAKLAAADQGVYVGY